MKISLFVTITLSLLPAISSAGKETPVSIIATEPVTMMDLGILKLNTRLSRQTQPGLRGATIGATYNASKGTIDIKVSLPVTKASRTECAKIINNAKKLLITSQGKEKTSNLYYYFQHEGTEYSRRVNWHSLGHHVVITGITLTRKNYRNSVYCQNRLMEEKITY